MSSKPIPSQYDYNLIMLSSNDYNPPTSVNSCFLALGWVRQLGYPYAVSFNILMQSGGLQVYPRKNCLKPPEETGSCPAHLWLGRDSRHMVEMASIYYWSPEQVRWLLPQWFQWGPRVSGHATILTLILFFTWYHFSIWRLTAPDRPSSRKHHLQPCDKSPLSHRHGGHAHCTLMFWELRRPTP